MTIKERPAAVQRISLLATKKTIFNFETEISLALFNRFIIQFYAAQFSCNEQHVHSETVNRSKQLIETKKQHQHSIDN